MALCTQADVVDVLSTEGVDDESRDRLVAASTVVSNAIERAGEQIKQYTFDRYATAALEGNAWAKWCCAVFAARILCQRGGDAVPTGVETQYAEFVEHLRRVAAGVASIPDATVRSQGGMTMSNQRVDDRYHTAKLRTQTRVSTGPKSSALTRDTEDYEYE